MSATLSTLSISHAPCRLIEVTHYCINSTDLHHTLDGQGSSLTIVVCVCVGVLSATLGAMKVWVLSYVGDWPFIWEILTERGRAGWQHCRLSLLGVTAGISL